MVVFFTIPPMTVKWPWILVNQFNVDTSPRTLTFTIDGSKIEVQTESYGWSYLLAHRQSVELILLDSGVEKLFRRPNPFPDYPPEYENLWLRNVERLTKLFGRDRVIVTVPDYPDDYVHVWGKPHALWKDGKDNIERSVENAVYYWDKYCTKLGLRCLIPVQGHFEDPASISRSVKLLHEYGLLKEGEIFGIANLCTTKRTSVIVEEARIARSLIGSGKWIHVFGPSLAAAGSLARYVDSFDTAVPYSRRRLWLAARLGTEYSKVLHLRSVEVEKMMFAKTIEVAVRSVKPDFRCYIENLDACINESINIFRSSKRNGNTFIDLSKWINHG